MKAEKEKLKTPVKIRPARKRDIPALLELEASAFNYDRLGRRSFQWMIKNGHSLFLVMESHSKLVGYGLVLLNSGTSLARLYSICTHPDYQGQGLATQLIDRLEVLASEAENCAYLRLEVKASNRGAIKLYQKLGYRKFAEKKNYYTDGETAWCFEKQIRQLKGAPRFKVPYYQQGTEFTCGPACLIMAMKALDRRIKPTLSLELDLWREATTIFMTSGHGGCGARGLALAAHRRGLRTELYLSHLSAMFVDSVRSQEKKAIVELVHRNWEADVKREKIPVHRKRFTVEDLKLILKEGGIPIILISTYHFDFHRAPHWVVVTACDEHFVYIHDPDQTVDEEHEGVISRVHIPIPLEQFARISRWGRSKMSAAVILKKGGP